MCKKKIRVLTGWGNFVLGVRLYKKTALMVCSILESELVQAVANKVISDVAVLEKEFNDTEEEMKKDPRFSTEVEEEDEEFAPAMKA